MTEQTQREELVGGFIMTGLVSLAFGYVAGKKAGKRELLQGLDRALRIIHEQKEQ